MKFTYTLFDIDIFVVIAYNFGQFLCYSTFSIIIFIRISVIASKQIYNSNTSLCFLLALKLK